MKKLLILLILFVLLCAGCRTITTYLEFEKEVQVFQDCYERAVSALEDEKKSYMIVLTESERFDKNMSTHDAVDNAYNSLRRLEEIYDSLSSDDKVRTETYLLEQVTKEQIILILEEDRIDDKDPIDTLLISDIWALYQ